VEPTSNCSSASGGALFAGAATVMQAVETQTLILYHTELTGQWPAAAARTFAARLPYRRRLALGSDSDATRASLAGTALAAQALAPLLKRRVDAGEFLYEEGEKPCIAGGRALWPGVGPVEPHMVRKNEHSDGDADFSIAHSGPWVGCAALRRGRVGFDIEMGTDERIAAWVVREAAVKATGEGVRALKQVPEIAQDAEAFEMRGSAWRVRRLDIFPGACAALVTSRDTPQLLMRAITLTELFAA
jgi:hypothetical protein